MIPSWAPGTSGSQAAVRYLGGGRTWTFGTSTGIATRNRGRSLTGAVTNAVWYTPEDGSMEHVLMEVWFRSFSFPKWVNL